jgi:hypothetical protein
VEKTGKQQQADMEKKLAKEKEERAREKAETDK